MLQLRTKSTSPRQGATIVEFAVVVSIFSLLLFGILEYCLFIYAYNVVENAAREGCRYGVVNVTDTTMINDTKGVVLNFMSGLDKKLTSYNCDVYMADANGNKTGVATAAQFGQYVCVEVSVTYVPITPGLTYLKTMTIRSKCSMGSEAN